MLKLSKKFILWFWGENMLFFSTKSENGCKFKKSEECSIFDSYNKLSSLKKTELIVEIFRIKWGKITIKILSWGLIIIFVAAIVDYFLRNRNLPLELKIFGALQIWVGFALGIVAMLFSIISMYLSFYNLELQKEAESKTKEIFENLKKDIIEEIKEEVSLELKDIRKDMLEHFGILEKMTAETKEKVSESVKKEVKRADPVMKKFFKDSNKEL